MSLLLFFPSVVLLFFWIYLFLVIAHSKSMQIIAMKAYSLISHHLWYLILLLLLNCLLNGFFCLLSFMASKLLRRNECNIISISILGMAWNLSKVPIVWCQIFFSLLSVDFKCISGRPRKFPFQLYNQTSPLSYQKFWSLGLWINWQVL